MVADFRILCRQLQRNRKGGILAEYTFIALASVMLIFGTIEISLELFARQAAEHGVAVASQVYAFSGSPELADERMRKAVGGLGAYCLAPPEIQLFDSVLDADFMDPTSGYSATDAGEDGGAVLARLTVACTWPRLTPVLAAAMGVSARHLATAYVRLR